MSQLEEIVDLIQQTDLDQTLKDILIRDLQNEGLTEFMREQLLAYCTSVKEEITKRIAELEQQEQTPAA